MPFLHEIEWWIPTERPMFTMWTPDCGFEQGDMLGADEVFCDQCNASIEFTPVPVISGNALCEDCFQKMFQMSVEEAAQRAGVTITYKEEVDDQTFEFRVRTFGDVRDWDQIPVTCRIEYSEHEPDPLERATLAARLILNLNPAQAGILYNESNPVEVRLNLAGSLNGHYVRK